MGSKKWVFQDSKNSNNDLWKSKSTFPSYGNNNNNWGNNSNKNTAIIGEVIITAIIGRVIIIVGEIITITIIMGIITITTISVEIITKWKIKYNIIEVQFFSHIKK